MKHLLHPWQHLRLHGLAQRPLASLFTALFTWLSCLLLSLFVAACTGVPLRSVPRLMQMPNQLVDANPADFMVALQVDARLTPPPGEVPMLAIQLTPKDPNAYPAIDKKLPLQLLVTGVGTLGLDAPPPGRRWLIYSLPAASQAELARVQATVRQAQRTSQQKGGTLTLGVTQDTLATTDPALAHTRWETWVQVSRTDGFLEVWSGTPAQLRETAKKGR